MADDEYYDDEEEDIDIESINDEQTLIDMLDEAEDFDDRKRIRDRLMKVQHEIRAKRAEQLKKIEDEREMALRKKMQDAEDKKKRTLAMYDQMAKSAPAGARKTMDVNIYKYNDAAGSRPDSPAPYDRPKDLVEDTIRQRARDAEIKKKRILAAYDHAAKSGPAGPKIVNFTEFSRADVSKFQPSTPPIGSSTFGMSGGIPTSKKAAPAPDSASIFHNEDNLDPMERAIRERKREADERKRRTLAAYDIIAKTGGVGPKVVVLEEFRDLKLAPDMKMGSAYDPTASFHGGVLATGGVKR